MATNNTIAVPATQVRNLDTGLFMISGKPTLPAAAAGDSITLFTFANAVRMSSNHLKVPATLGAGVTLKMQKNTGGTRTDIGVVTTAATAGVVTGVTIGPVDFVAGDTIELLVAGGTVTPQIVEYDVLCQRK